MSVDDIKDLTRQLKRDIEGEDDLANSDPEIWEHLFIDDFADTLKKTKPSAVPGMEAACRDLYKHIKKVTDEALLKSDLGEAFSVFKYQVPGLLTSLAKIDATVGAEILADLKNEYAKSDDEEVADIGRKTAAKIQKSLTVVAGETPAFNAAAAGDNNSGFSGKTLVFTGTLSTMKRDDAAKICESLGAHIGSGVSKNTDCLIVGADAGSKLDKAKALGIQILTEDEFNKAIKRGTTVAVMKTLSFKKPD